MLTRIKGSACKISSFFPKLKYFFRGIGGTLGNVPSPTLPPGEGCPFGERPPIFLHLILAIKGGNIFGVIIPGERNER